MKALCLFLICSLFALTFTQNCQNPLLATFGLTGLANPQNSSSLPYCGALLQSSQTCCSAQTVRGFATSATSLTQRLQNYASERDQYLYQLNTSNLAVNYQNLFDQLSQFDSAIDDINDNNNDVGGLLRTQYDALSNVNSGLGDVSGNNFNEALGDYQQKRLTCFSTVLKIQASAWCLACDPNYANEGVGSDGNIAFSDSLCSDIAAACAPFVIASDVFTPLINANLTYNRVIDLVNFLTNRSNNADTIPNVFIDGDLTNLTNATLRTNTVPEDCDAESCPWQCQNIFATNGVLNEEEVANGAGIIGGGDLYLPGVGVVGGQPISDSSVLNGTALESTVDSTITAPTEIIPPVTTTDTTTSDSTTTNSSTAPITDSSTAPATNSSTASTTDSSTAPTTDSNTAPATNSSTASTTDSSTAPTTDSSTAPTTDSSTASTTDTNSTVITSPPVTTTTTTTSPPVTTTTVETTNTTNATSGTRLLQSIATGNTWSPNFNSTGLTFNLTANPANIPNIPTVITGIKGDGGSNSEGNIDATSAPRLALAGVATFMIVLVSVIV